MIVVVILVIVMPKKCRRFPFITFSKFRNQIVCVWLDRMKFDIMVVIIGIFFN